MDLSTAFGPDIGIDQFFADVLVALHAARPGEFESLSDIPVLICVKFDDGRVFSVSASADEVEVEADEAVDFPLLTVFGRVADWDIFKEWVLRYAEAYENRKSELSTVFRFTQKFADELEKYDTAAHVALTNSTGDRMEFELVLNNYEIDPGFKKFTVELDVDILDDIANGVRTPAEVAKGLKVGGDYGAAAELGAVAMRFRP